jgi:crotonobetainyl-CoA:carnitine CoA-transferase CaiB-like acyl-CoA transferase
MAVGAIEPQFWAELVQALELYLDQTPSPHDPSQRQACTALLTSIFRTRTRDEWASLFEHRDAGVAPALTLEEPVRDRTRPVSHDLGQAADQGTGSAEGLDLTSGELAIEQLGQVLRR